MTWRTEFRYNGRIQGAHQSIVCETEAMPDDNLMMELVKKAVRKADNGAIFIIGWNVEWVDEP